MTFTKFTKRRKGTKKNKLEKEIIKVQMKADLHMHGPIGFQPYWLKAQSYAGKNLLKEIADEAFKKNNFKMRQRKYSRKLCLRF